MNKRKLVTDRRPGWQGPYGAVDMNSEEQTLTEVMDEAISGKSGPVVVGMTSYMLKLHEDIARLSKETEILAARMNHYQHALQEIWDIADQCNEPISSKLASDALTKKV
jgi:hypothetical protein